MGTRKSGEFLSEVIVGFFMIGVLALLAYFTIIISGVDVVNGTSKVQRMAEFVDVGGLKLRDSVVMRGIPIGSVDKLGITKDGVSVTLLLQKNAVLHEGYSLDVVSGSLLGGNYLLLTDGTGAELPENAILHGRTPTNWMRDLGEIVANLKESLHQDEIRSIITNIQEATTSIRTVVTRVEQGEGTLGKLLSSDSTLYTDLSNTVVNIRSITEKVDVGENSLGRLLNDTGSIYTNLDATVANLRTITERVEQGEGTIGKLLSSDAALYQDLEKTVANLKAVTDRLEQGNGTLGKLMKDENQLYNNLNETVANLKIAAERLQKGEGTLGKLSADDKLYNEVQGLLQDVRQTVDNYRDTTPITAFASLLMGAL